MSVTLTSNLTSQLGLSPASLPSTCLIWTLGWSWLPSLGVPCLSHWGGMVAPGWQGPCPNGPTIPLGSWLCIPWGSSHPNSTGPIKSTGILNSVRAHLIASPLPQTLLRLNKPYLPVKAPSIICVCWPCGSHWHSATQPSFQFLLCENFALTPVLVLVLI